MCPVPSARDQAIEAAADGIVTLIDQAGAGDTSGLPFSTT